MGVEITKDLVINQIYKFKVSDLTYLESVSKVFSEFGSYISQSNIDDYEFEVMHVSNTRIEMVKLKKLK